MTTPIATEILAAVANYSGELKAVGIGALGVGVMVLVFKRGFRFFKSLSG